MANFLTAILMVLTLSACSESRFAQNSLLKAKPNGDSDKISDGSEGVPGYLTDPGSLRFSRVGDMGTVIGSAGAVVPGAAKLSELVVELWGQTADATELSQARKISNSSIATDGSFAMQFNLVPEDAQLFITVEKSPGAASLRFIPAGKGRYQAASRASASSDEGFSGITITSGDRNREELESAEPYALTTACAKMSESKGYPTFPDSADHIRLDESKAYRNFRISKPNDIYELNITQDTTSKLIGIHIDTFESNGGTAIPVDNINFNLTDSSAIYCLDIPVPVFLKSTTFILGCKTRLLYDFPGAPADEAALPIKRLCN